MKKQVIINLYLDNIQIFIDRLFGEVFMLRIIGWQGMVNPPTWSLYVEVSFYIVAPLIFLLIKKQKILFIGIEL